MFALGIVVRTDSKSGGTMIQHSAVTKPNFDNAKAMPEMGWASVDTALAMLKHGRQLATADVHTPDRIGNLKSRSHDRLSQKMGVSHDL